MRRIGNVIGVVAGLLAVGAVAWWFASATVADRVRQLLQTTLSAALGAPVELAGLDITLFPVTARGASLTIGPDGNILRVDHVQIRIDAWKSLRTLRPEGTMDVEGLALDVPALVDAIESVNEQAATVPLSILVRRVRITNATVRVRDDDPRMDASFGRLVGRIDLNGVTGELRLAAHIRRGKFVREGEELPVATARVEGSIGGDDIRISRLLVRGKGVRLIGWLRGGVPTRHTLRGELALEHFRLFADALEPLAGELSIDATFNGSLLHPDATAELVAQDVRFDRESLGDWRGATTLRDGRLALEGLRGQVYGGDGSVDATLVLRDEFAYGVTAQWHGVDPALAAHAEPGGWLHTMLAAGQVQLDGTLDPATIRADSAGTFARADGSGAPVRWTANARSTDSGGEFALAVEQSSANRAQGNVTVQRDGALSGGLQINVADTHALASLLQSAPARVPSGTLNAAVELGGTVQAPSWTAEVRGKNVTGFGVTVADVGGKLAGDTERIRAEGLSLQIDGGSAQIEGTFALADTVVNTWSVWLRDVPGSVVVAAAAATSGTSLPIAGGRLSGRAAGSGPWSAVKLHGNAELDEFRLADEPMQRLIAEVDATWPQWSAHATLVHRDEETLTARTQGRAAESLALAVESTTWRIEAARGAERQGVAGGIRVRADVKGPPARLGGWVEIEATDIRWAGRRADSVVLRADGNAGRWDFRGDLDQRITLNGSYRAQSDTVAMQASWQDAELAPLLSDDPDLRVASSGTVSLTVPWRQPALFSGDMNVPELTITRGEYTAAATAPIRIRAQRGRCTIDSLSLSGTGVELTATGEVSTAGEVHLRVQGRGDLRQLDSFSSEIESARGEVTLDATVEHPLGGEWNLTGGATVTGVSLDVGLPVAFADVEGRLSFKGPVIQIDELGGRAGGGTLKVGGTIDVATGPALTWAATEVALTPLPDVNAEVSGEGTVHGSWDDITVAGEVRVARAVYDRNIALTDFIPWFRRSVARPRSAPSTRVVRLDLRIVAPGDVFVDNNVAEVEMSMDLRVGGTTAAITLAGSVEVLEGKVTFRDHTFDITRGTVDFRPELGLNPYLNASAETTIDTTDASYTIIAVLVGTLDNYRVHLSSDDAALSQTDIASLVAFGKTTAQMQQEGSGVSMNDLLALTPNLVTGQVEAGVRYALPVDRVEIEPGYSKTSGLYEPRVSLGKDLTENLRALVSTTLGVETRRAVQLEYRLTPRISLLGSWESATTQQSGAFGGDVKVRYQFRRLSGFSLLAPWRGWYVGELQ